MAISTLPPIAQRILQHAELPLEKAIALPASAYTNAEYYQWEVEHILKRQWLCVGHQSQIPNPGDYLHFDLLDEPLIVTRDKQDQIHVLSRVCVHRGMDLMPTSYGHDTKGNRSRLLCPYHHWSYELDGSLVAAPEMQKHQTFHTDQYCLPQFKCEIWQGFIFVSFTDDIPSLKEQFSGLFPFVEQRNMADLEMVISLEWDCHFNWKVLVENFMESYHHLGAHHKTFEPIMPAAGTWSESNTGDSIVAHLPFSPRVLQDTQTHQEMIEFVPSPDLKPQDRNEYAVYLGSPTFLLFGGPDRVYWYGLQPLAADRMTLTTTMLIHPESKQSHRYEELHQDAIDSLKRFHLEDMEMCTAVQTGLNSSRYQPGPLSHLEMPVWLFQRYLAKQIKLAVNER